MAPGTNILFQYGAIGVVLVFAFAALRVLFAKLTAELDRQTQRGDRLELELIKLNETVRNEYVSTISLAARSASEAAAAVANALAAVRRD